MSNTQHIVNGMFALVVAAAFAGCGSSTPSSPGGGGGGGGTTAATITISASGVVSPKTVTVPAGSRVAFVNNHSTPHQMSSNPHPEHTDCPAINDVGTLTLNQTRTTGNLNTVRTCGFHDHSDEFNTNLQGTIVIQ